MAEIPWRACVVDEAHRLRNVNSKLLECFKAVVAKGQIAYGYQHRVLMTGTPLQNNTAELWSLLNFIEPAKFPDADRFEKLYGQIKTQEQVENLQHRIAPHLLRRVKEDVAKDIPPKEETIIDVELTTLQKQYYRAIFERNLGVLKLAKGNMPKLMNIQMELRKCCNHPFLVHGVEDREYENLETNVTQTKVPGHINRIDDLLVPSSGKMVLIDKLLPKLKKEGHKVLVFSQMVKMIDMLFEYAEARGYSCEKLTGGIKGNDRQKSIDRFNNDPDSFLFLLSTRAGGVGINLTAADTCIIFDSDWNPQNDVQAMARCHRIGQSKQVKIYRLITRRSFEAEMFERASKKLGLEQAVLGTREFSADDHDETKNGNAKIASEEMEQLLREVCANAS
jgi:chromodomain-helicase-DNA-binding protein 7